MKKEYSENLGISITGIINGKVEDNSTTVIDYSALTEKKETFPFHLLPDWLQEIINEHSDSYGTPKELWATAFLSGISAGAGKKFQIITGNYENYPQLWIMVVGSSGTGKSEAFRVAYRQLERINKDREAEYRAKHKEWEENEKQGTPPRWEQLIINDTTPEALYSTMRCTPNGLTLYRDELSGWFSDFGRYNKSGEVGHYLSMFDNQDFSVNRKKEDSFLVSEPLLNIAGTIQPQVLAEVLGKNNAEVSGFAQRFLYLYPEFTERKYKKNSKKPNLSKYNDFITYLVDNQFDGMTALRSDAEDVYADFYNEMERERSQSNDFWSAVYSKAQIQVLRLALTIKIARLPEKDTGYTEKEDIQCAVGMMRYFISSLEKFKDETKPVVKKSDLIRGIFEENPEASQSEVARILKVSQPYVNKVIRL